MRLEQLEFLIEIARQSSIVAASELLHVTPQTLSSSIKSLELELNVQILVRSNKGVKLTEEGKKVLYFAQEIIERYIELKSSLNFSLKHKDTLKGQLTIHTSAIYLDSILPQYIQQFKNSYPQIKLNIKQSSSVQTLSLLNCSSENQNNHVGMFLIPYRNNIPIPEFLPLNERIKFKIYSFNRYYAVISNNSSYINQKSISLHKLLQRPIIICTSNNTVSHPLITLLKDYQPDLQIAATVSTISFLAAAIRADLGIGFIPKFILSTLSIKNLFDGLKLLTFKESIVTANCLIYHENNPIEIAFVNQFPKYRAIKGDPEIIL